MTSFEDSKAGNIELLYTIAKLFPNESYIRMNYFARHYPDYNNIPQKQEDLDEFINQLLSWYYISVSNLFESLKKRDERLKEWDERLKEWDERLKERDERLKERDVDERLKERDEGLKEKDGRLTLRDDDLKEKNERLNERLREKDESLMKKDKRINDLVSSWIDMLSTLKDLARKDKVQDRKWSTVTRSRTWHSLEEDGRVKYSGEIHEQVHDKRASLESKIGKISMAKWKEEKDMYPDIIEAMKYDFYTEGSGPKVVDTHDRPDFRPSISVSDYSDEKLVYCLWYFIEFKLPSISLITPNHCGQILDFFHKAREKHPHRWEFVGILSNFESTWIFTARYDEDTVTIFKRRARTLTDAIIFADSQSRLQYSNLIRKLDDRLSPNFDVIAIGKHHSLLEVELPVVEIAKVNPTVPSTIYNTHGNSKASTEYHPWRPPRRHQMSKTFVLKVVHGGTTVEAEIEILKMIRDADCVHLPELVWEPGGEREFGILPVCEPITFKEPQKVSRKIVAGLMDGLKWLHSRNIIHRDIRPSNLVIDGFDNLVIIDYETAVVRVEGVEVEYLGGFICWPKRLIESRSIWYVPEPEDDLFASILAVSHMIFPTRFEGFRVSSIGVERNSSPETRRLLNLWKDIEDSEQWGPFASAARDCDYERLKKMGDMFCHI